jgi:hypothetical protein
MVNGKVFQREHLINLLIRCSILITLICLILSIFNFWFIVPVIVVGIYLVSYILYFFISELVCGIIRDYKAYRFYSNNKDRYYDSLK